MQALLDNQSGASTWDSPPPAQHGGAGWSPPLTISTNAAIAAPLAPTAR